MSVVGYKTTGQLQGRENRDSGEFTEQFLIRVNDENDGFEVLRRDIPELQRWQRHPTESGYFVDEFAPERIPNTLYFRAAVRYTNTISKSPLDLPTELSIRSETVPGATIFDRKGRLIQNAAGDPVQPIDKPERVRVFVFEKNLAKLEDWLYDLEDTTNSSSVQIRGKTIDQRKLLLKKVEIGKRQVQDDIEFYPTLVELWYRKTGWLLRYPNVGFNQVILRPPVGDEENWRVIDDQGMVRDRVPIEANGARVTEPQPLNAEGEWIQDAKPEDLVFLTAEIYDESDLNVLGTLLK